MGLFQQPQEDPQIGLIKQELGLKKDVAMVDAATRDDMAYEGMSQEKEQILKWQQDLSPELELFKHDLLREVLNDNNVWVKEEMQVFDTKENTWVQKNLPPIMNARGVSFVLTTVKRYLNRNVMRCSLTEDNIRRIMKSFGIALSLNLAENYDTYALDMSQFHTLNVNSRHVVETTLYRALNNGERINERAIIRIIESKTNSEQDPLKKKSLFGGM